MKVFHGIKLSQETKTILYSIVMQKYGDQIEGALREKFGIYREEEWKEGCNVDLKEFRLFRDQWTGEHLLKEFDALRSSWIMAEMMAEQYDDVSEFVYHESGVFDYLNFLISKVRCYFKKTPF